MKKTFKFFMCAAIVAAGFTACSDEVTPITDGDGNPIVTPGEKGEATSATFNFSLADAAAKTKALNSDGSENVNLKTVTEFRVLIFDNESGALEVDTARSIAANDSLLTIPLISGTKKIFVYVNGGITAGPPVSSPAYLSVPAKAAAFNSYAQANTEYKLYSAATLGTDLDNMHKLYPNTVGAVTKFFFSSTVAEAVQTVQPGISANDSKDPTNVNYFNINVDRSVAKMAVTQTAGAGSGANATTIDTKGTILASSIQYKVWNVNAAMFPFQNYSNGDIATPQYLPTSADDPDTKLYYAREQGNGAANAYIPISYRSAAPVSGGGSYFYISENNPSTKMKGNTTIAAVEAQYLPKALYYVTNAAANTAGTEVLYNENTAQFSLTPATADQTGAATDMYLFTAKGVSGVAENTLFSGNNALLLAKKVYYHILNPAAATLPTLAAYASVDETSAGFLAYFDKYTAGKAYYRLEIGKQSGTTVDCVVRRNWYYDANITGFLKLGENDPYKLVYPENEVIKGPTALTIHIIIRDWTGTEINTNI